MRPFYLLLLFFVLLGALQAQHQQPLQGYIVTKNHYHLTGFIGQIDHSQYGTMVKFINDFGTPYVLHPALIRGFVFYEGPAIYAYESKLWRSNWLFLRVLYAGDNVRLLQTPELQTDFVVIDGQMVAQRKKIKQFWVEVAGGRILPLKRSGFRGQMKSLIADVSPQLAQKIGRPGYRFQNLYEILAEYDQECIKGKRRL
ncbi:MAG: hypothetical protein DA408_11305 [Bacteroidetes bacterium]|nr:MAG: hypothetical protein C7N36_17000 [Bacteroidota bacterium]PTM12262.1 MAG: hypothetical protein DA408_11305 [Bacteroidota bacterium]